jgi:hypothetical protein
MAKYVLTFLNDCCWPVPLAVCDSVADCEPHIRDHAHANRRRIVLKSMNTDEHSGYPRQPGIAMYYTNASYESYNSYLISELPE